MEEKRNDSSANHSDSESWDQHSHDPERNEIYSEVYEHKTPQGSIRSSKNGSGAQHQQIAYINQAKLSDVVVEVSELPRNETSPPPPLPVGTPGSITVVDSPTNGAKPKQSKSAKNWKTTKPGGNHSIDYENRDPENLQEFIKVRSFLRCEHSFKNQTIFKYSPFAPKIIAV